MRESGFKIGDPVYIITGANGTTRRAYGHITDIWSGGRLVDIQFAGSANTWPFKADHVYHAVNSAEDRQEANHVIC